MKRRSGLASLAAQWALFALLLQGCASGTSTWQEPALAPAQVVVISPAPTASSTAIVAAAEPAPSVDVAVSAWEGVWEDPETQGKVRTTVRLERGRPIVVDIKESVGELERYELRSTRWEAGSLAWTEYVPSTNYLVDYRCATPSDDELSCAWENDHQASGKVTMRRVTNR